MSRKIVYSIITVLVLSVLAGCSMFSIKGRSTNPHFLVGDKNQKKELKHLYREIDRQNNTYEERFVFMEQIIKIFYAAAEERLNLFIQNYVSRFKDDPFNGYYLLIVAWNYQEAEAYPFAVLYYERILKLSGYNGKNKSAYNICLTNLVDLVDDPTSECPISRN